MKIHLKAVWVPVVVALPILLACATIDTCCTASKSDCYVVANTRPLPCPNKNCVAPDLLNDVATACGVSADGDADSDEGEATTPASHTDL